MSESNEIPRGTTKTWRTFTFGERLNTSLVRTRVQIPSIFFLFHTKRGSPFKFRVVREICMNPSVLRQVHRGIIKQEHFPPDTDQSIQARSHPNALPLHSLASFFSVRCPLFSITVAKMKCPGPGHRHNLVRGAGGGG